MSLHDTVLEVTERIRKKSRPTRAHYLALMRSEAEARPRRARHDCANLAHGSAAAPASDRTHLKTMRAPNIAIVTSYNDMLSAHMPFEHYPARIKEAVRSVGGVAQVAGGVPAMCDGITQGTAGMELSLLSRDVIALSTALALSHDMFDGVLCLGVCDKIVPGLLIGALRFGHLPTVFVPAGPMPSGISNAQKNAVRQQYAVGQVDKRTLLESEYQSYHAPGTCTFYGTANSNQMLMEIMGLHLPGAAFVPPGTKLRDALTEEAARTVVGLTSLTQSYRPLAEVVCEESLVNGIVGLLATGGSTNHTLHIVAIARAAGIVIDWSDFADLSKVVPLIARVYPNGKADVNEFHVAGGTPYVIRELLGAGLLHAQVATAAGADLSPYTRVPFLGDDGRLRYTESPRESRDTSIVRPCSLPFAQTGGLQLLQGNLGRAVIKTSAVAKEHRRVRAKARVFDSQEQVQAAFTRGELNESFIAVVRFQGPRANGMPELHKLTPTLGALQDRGLSVALVTDGRMSGASGKVPAAIHVTPESASGGPLAKVQNGDVILIDADEGVLQIEVDAETWEGRALATLPSTGTEGLGRELFAGLRAHFGEAEHGALSLPLS